MAWVFTVIFGKSYWDGIDFYLFLFGLSKILHDMVGGFHQTCCNISMATGKLKGWKFRPITDTHT